MATITTFVHALRLGMSTELLRQQKLLSHQTNSPGPKGPKAWGKPQWVTQSLMAKGITLKKTSKFLRNMSGAAPYQMFQN